MSTRRGIPMRRTPGCRPLIPLHPNWPAARPQGSPLPPRPASPRSAPPNVPGRERADGGDPPARGEPQDLLVAASRPNLLRSGAVSRKTQDKLAGRYSAPPPGGWIARAARLRPPPSNAIPSSWGFLSSPPPTPTLPAPAADHPQERVMADGKAAQGRRRTGLLQAWNRVPGRTSAAFRFCPRKYFSVVGGKKR